MTWLTYHWGTMLVSLLLLLAVAAVVCVLRRDKKQGKSSCGGGCAGCAMRGKCHGQK